MKPSYSVIIPAYNEQMTIASAVEETQRVFSEFDQPFEIIVVDDGSCDRTAEIVESMKNTVPELVFVRHKHNEGKGAAVKSGVMSSRGDVFLFLDADLATHPKEFAKCIPYLGTYDIIIGSRHVAGSQIIREQSFARSLLGRAFNEFVRLFLNLPFKDTQCGFKTFHSTTKDIFNDLQTSGWVFDVELLKKAMQRKFSILEIPIVWKNGDESGLRISHIPKIFKELLDIQSRIR